MLTRRFLLCLASLLLALVAKQAFAEYPDRPLKLIVPYPPGGSTDGMARTVAETIKAQLGQPVVVENRGGAGGQIGVEAIASAAPDGYTIGLVALSNFVAYALKGESFAVQERLTPIGNLAFNPVVLLTNPKVIAAKSFKDFLAFAKEKDGLPYGTAGVGSTGHLFMAVVGRETGIKFTNVPYRGCVPALNDLVSGNIGFVLCDVASAVPFLRSGQLAAIGMTGSGRNPIVPDAPVLVDQDLPGDIKRVAAATLLSIGFVAPAGLPEATMLKLQAAFKTVATDPKVMQYVESIGSQPNYLPPDQYFGGLIKALELWSSIIRLSGIKVD